MSAEIAQLPTKPAVDRAWERYVALVRAVDHDERLRTDIQHQQSVALAWDHWRNLFLASSK